MRRRLLQPHHRRHPSAPPAAVEATPKPPTATEAMPATRPDVLPPIQVGAWMRVGGVFQGSDPSKVNDWRMDNAYAELHAGGKIHQKVSVTLNLNANMASYHGGGLPIGLGNPLVVGHGRDHLVRPRWTSSTCGPATCWSPSTARTPPVRSS